MPMFQHNPRAGTPHHLAQRLQLLLCAKINCRRLLWSCCAGTALRCSSLQRLQLPIQLLVLCLRLVQLRIQLS